MTNPGPLHGELWWVTIPNQPNDPHQPRTAVIVSPDGRNKYANDVIVVPTTSALQKPHPEMHIHIPAGEGGLPKDSYAKCDQVTTIDKSLLDTAKGPLGNRIHRKYRWDILEGVRIALGDTRV